MSKTHHTPVQLTLLSRQEPPPMGIPYRMYSDDTPDEEISAAFARRFGAPPVEIIRWNGHAYAGPIPAGMEIAR